MSLRESMPRLRGLLAAPPTAFHDDGSVNIDFVDIQAQKLADIGADGVFVGGTTGEHFNMTLEERKLVNARWVTAIRRINQTLPEEKRLSVTLQVGTSVLLDSVELAKHAAEVKPDAYAALPPYYYQPTSIVALVATMRRIADAAPNLPFYYYHIPEKTSVTLDMVAFLQAGSQVMPNLVGMKYSHDDVNEFSRCKALGFTMITGKDAMLYYFLSAGADGAIGCNYNYPFAVPLFQKMITAIKNNDHQTAFQIQSRALLFTLLIKKYGGIASIKAISKISGLDVGIPRLPLLPVSDQEYAALEKVLKDNNLLNPN